MQAKVIKRGTPLHAILSAKTPAAKCRCRICHDQRIAVRKALGTPTFELDAREYISSKPDAWNAKTAFDNLFKPTTEGQD